MNNLIVTIPHAGERVPEALTPWLIGLPESILMADVDRFVDRLYAPSLVKFHIPCVTTEWHRYAVDLNRIPQDVDSASVIGVAASAGSHPHGFHWVKTMNNEVLMAQPMSQETHQNLTDLIYEPFHQTLRNFIAEMGARGESPLFQIDAHSMPSLGTAQHRDPGETRADIVISDCLGKSCGSKFRDLVIAAYATAGFRVAYNWPYYGGRVTEQYGDPAHKRHAIQVEIKRGLYMDESTKKLKPQWLEVQHKIERALGYICQSLANF